MTSQLAPARSQGREVGVTALRRLDWRFLLDRPLPERALFVGPADDMLLDCLRDFGLDVDVHASEGWSRAKPYELVVLKDPDWSNLEGIADVLAPGAALYGELGPQVGAWYKTRRALTNLQFHNVQRFWHHPGFEQCKRIVPLDAPAALRYAASGSGRRGARLRGSLLGLASRTATAGHLARATSFVTYGPGAGADGGLNTAMQFLNDARHDLGLDRFGPLERLDPVLITPRFAASAHVVWLLVDRITARPVLVLKSPRSPAGIEALAGEASNLREVHIRWPQADASVPTCLSYGARDDTVWLLETGLAGTPLSADTVRRRRHSSTEAIVDWVIELGRQTAVAGRGQGAYRRLVTQPLAAWEGDPWNTSSAQALARRTRHITQSLLSHPVPVVMEHGDLSAPNLLIDDTGRLQVVDWELGEHEAFPGADLVYALTFIASALHGSLTVADHLEAFDRAFFGADAWAVPHVERYADVLGIPRPAISPLFLVACSRWVTRLPARFEAAGTTARSVSGQTSQRLREYWRHAVEHVNRLGWDLGGDQREEGSC